MPADITNILKNTKDIFMSDSAVVTLMDFERVIDELNLYAYDNWKKGELVEGPDYEKYFVRCVFMWPYKMMPDPRGGRRLLDYGCEVRYQKELLAYPVKIKSPDDFEAGTKMPKMKTSPIWLVEIVMPKKLMQDITQGSVELENETIDAEDIEQAYESGMDEESYKSPSEAPAEEATDPTLGAPV
jgi:hypothetical protein